MALLAPNIYILQYLRNTDQMTPAIKEKATNFLTSGELGVPGEFAETLPPTKCHLSIKVTTYTRNMDARSESFLLLNQLLARQLTKLTIDCSSSSMC